MDGDFIPLLEVKEGLLITWPHKSVSHNDYAHVLHTIDTEFGDKDHVVFFEREFARKVGLEKVYGKLNGTETLVWVG